MIFFFFVEVTYELAVKKEFKYLKENIIFEAVLDEVKGLICDENINDYICSTPCKYFWVEKIIKLMIKKKCCHDFIESIQHSHPHVFARVTTTHQLLKENGHLQLNCKILFI